MPGKLVILDDLGDTQELLAKFALRLTGDTSGRSAEGYPRLCVGGLSDEFPMELSLPPNTQIIGTIIRSPGTAQVYAETPEVPERVLQFLDEILLAEGWKQTTEILGPRGFQPGPSEEFESAHYCMTESGPALHITVRASSEAVSEIMVSFQAEARGSCNPKAQKRRMGAMHGLSLVPRLLAPAGTWKSGGGGGGGSDHWHTSAILETEMTLDDVMEHYAEQLDASNWTRLGTIERGETLVTYWELVDSKERPYIGLMDVKRLETRPELRYLHLIVSRIDQPRGSSEVWAA